MHVFLYEVQSWQRQASIVIQGILNLIAQRDQQTTIEIAKDSKILAEDGRRDNISLKAIATLTTFFLPGTFLACEYNPTSYLDCRTF